MATWSSRTTLVEEVSTLEGLEGLRGAWEEAQARSAPGNVFATFDWALAWWRHFGAGRRLRVLVIRDGNGPPAILPFWEGPLWRRFMPFRRIQVLGTGLSDRLDLLLSEDAAASAQTALRHLLSPPARWDVLDIRELPEGSPALEALRAAANQLGLECEVSADSESCYLAVESDWETFLSARLGTKSRKRIRHNANRLEAEHAPVTITLGASPEGSPLVARLAAMPQDAEYRGEGRRSIFATPTKRAFFEEVVQRFSRRGWLRVGLLECAGEVAAFRFAFLYDGKYLDYFTGFHRDYAKVSPGSILLARVMEDCFRNRVREIDFLRGTEPWKEAWTDRRRRNVRLRVYRPGLRRPAVRVLFRMKDGRSGRP